ncbi:MAG: GNAT family N-acetyltransferase [Mangrovibacterium sp.]
MQSLVVDSSIRLEEVRYSHGFQIFQAIDQNRGFLSPWLPFVQQTQSQDDTEAFIRSVLSEPANERDDVFVIWFDGVFAGLIGLKDKDLLNRKIEIGYWLTQPMTGKGIVTKSVRALIDWLFGSMQMNRVQIKCGVGNLASSAIPKRLGFSFEGIERAGERHRDRYIDLEIYSLLKIEWKNKLLN